MNDYKYIKQVEDDIEEYKNNQLKLISNKRLIEKHCALSDIKYLQHLII